MNVAAAMVMFSVLFPSKTWFAPDQAWMINVKPQGEITLVLTDFTGRPISAKEGADISVSAEKTVDIKALYPSVSTPGTYALRAVPKGADVTKFVGTPLVLSV